jgi:single-strand DNA-binding protein
MASLNKVMLIGYLGDEPKVERLQSGAVVAKLTLATTKKGYTTQSGSVVPDRTEWHRISYWGKLAELAERYLHKGSSVYVEGELVTESWDDADGKKHYQTKIQGNALQMLDKKQTDSETSSAQPKPQQEAANPSQNDEDLPF